MNSFLSLVANPFADDRGIAPAAGNWVRQALEQAKTSPMSHACDKPVSHASRTTRFVHGRFPAKCLRLLGGRTRARTWDPLIKSQLLYQLSYAPGARSGKAFA